MLGEGRPENRPTRERMRPADPDTGKRATTVQRVAAGCATRTPREIDSMIHWSINLCRCCPTQQSEKQTCAPTTLMKGRSEWPVALNECRSRFWQGWCHG